MRLTYCLAFAALAASGGVVSAALTYTARDLNPSGTLGSDAFAASGAFQGGDSTSPNLMHATLWNLTAASHTDLHPSAIYDSSAINGMGGNQQVGVVRSDFQFGNANTRAFLWKGTAASAINLHPANINANDYQSSNALATDGTQQVGIVRGGATFGQYHASLWSGTAASYVDLNPTNSVSAAQSSSASAIANGVEGGYAVVYKPGTFSNPRPHAYIWTGTAASGVDLHPNGYDQTYITGTTGTQHGGWGISDGGLHHALFWPTSAATVVDLNPSAAYSTSEVRGVANGIEVGYAFNNATSAAHAIAWFGSAASAVDLQAFLPAGFTSSQAYGVTAEGYIVGYAYNGTAPHAFIWIPDGLLPEPTSIALLGLSAALMRRRR